MREVRESALDCAGGNGGRRFPRTAIMNRLELDSRGGTELRQRRVGDDAGPEVPMLYLFGLALASATNSASVLIGSLASMTRIIGGPSTIQPIIAKSSTGW